MIHLQVTLTFIRRHMGFPIPLSAVQLYIPEKVLLIFTKFQLVPHAALYYRYCFQALWSMLYLGLDCQRLDRIVEGRILLAKFGGR